MNKNFKIITINGIRGIFAAAFIVMGLIAGFVISPGWLAMTIWNHFAEEYGNISMMNLLQGIMLWAIIALSLYALNNKRALIGFGSYQGLSPEQLREVMNRARMSEDKIKTDIEKLTKELKANAEKSLNEEPKVQETVTEESSEKEEIGSKS